MKFQFSKKDNLASQTYVLVPILQNEQLAENKQTLIDELGLPAFGIEKTFKAEAGEEFVYFNGEQKITLLGLGSNIAFSSILSIFKKFTISQKKHFPEDIALWLPKNEINDRADEFFDAMFSGILLGCYDVGLYKSNRKKNTLEQIVVLSENEKQLTKIAKRSKQVVETQCRIMDLVNAPANLKTPQTLADWASASGKKHDYKVTILEKSELKKLGMNALLAVSKGSKENPFCIVMEYNGAKNAPKIGLVGKGVTFDTGGISLKQSTNMHFMKSDMGGAAAVLGAMELAAKLKLPVNLIGVIPTTENCIDANAIKPGDVVTAYNGKTIEIIDTDAEGRLILADALAYLIDQFNPSAIVDLATLTGSCIQTLGYHAGGLFTNNTTLAAKLQEAGDSVGERLWQLPLWDVYKEDIDSDIADVKNYSGKPVAGAISAAKFLEAFTNAHTAWAHLDIAGVAFGSAGYAKDRSATAFGIRLLVNFLDKINKDTF